MNDRDIAIVIGASNVSRGLSQLADVVTRRHHKPIDLFVTAGHGRSYGVSSSIGIRRLPSILGCGLWRELDGHLSTNARSRISALVTDVGNDLIYGYPPETVSEWVREVSRRLSHRRAKIAIVRLPLESVARASELRYLAVRALFSPWLKLNFSEMKKAASVLDQSLLEIAKEFGAEIIDQPGDWYGLDVIHIRLRQIHELWNAACDAWGLDQSGEVTSSKVINFRQQLALQMSTAEKRSLFGIQLKTVQPCFHYENSGSQGFRLWLH
jgi:hypothetical protein